MLGMIVKPDAYKAEVTSETLERSVTSEDWRAIDDRLDDRGCSDNDAWSDLWARNHTEQWELLGGTDRRSWTIDLPRSTDIDVHAARKEYIRYMQFYRLLDASRNASKPLTREQSIVADIASHATDSYICDRVKPNTALALTDSIGWESGETARNGLFSRYNAIGQAIENTRKTKPMELVCSIKPMAFLGLGAYAPCKKGNSCYRVGGEYGSSPVHVGGGTDSVVWFLKDTEGKCIARCFGSWTRSGGHIQNVYTIGKDKNAIARAISQVLGVDMMPTSEHRRHCTAIYHNSDAMAWSDPSYIGSDVEACDLVEPRGTACEDCGDTFDDDDMAYIDGHGYVCQNCLDNNWCWSDYQDCYIPSDEAVYVEESDTYIDCDHSDLCESIEGTYFIAR